MVPRPIRGVIYCGRVISKFELVDDPPWYERYMRLRGDEDDETRWHAADIAQCWRIDEFQPIPIPRIPAWIRRSLFGRSTYGVIHPNSMLGDPYDAISSILLTDKFEVRTWTLDVPTIERRLLTYLTPSTFEHLVVSLLQLEHPNEVWTQVGGSGDGGIDGVGASQDGQVTGLLQCKWQYWGEDPFPTDPSWRAGDNPFRRYLAALRYPDEGLVHPHLELLNRPKIAQLVAKHHHRLPEALSLRIGDCPHPEASTPTPP